MKKMNALQLTIWFVKTSKSYVSPWKMKDYLYYPIAYFKFMRLMYK